jgi:hypothetical protein
MRKWLALVVLFGALSAGSAHAQGYLYGGLHPINPTAGGGFCYTTTPHDHDYPIDPNISYLYRLYNGYYYFVGNVYDFGYQGEAFPYYGHHPVPDWGSYCYLNGVHYHYFLPPSSLVANYVVHNGYYYFRGVFPPAYYTYRTNYYRPRLSYWYLPAYRTYRTNYVTSWRTYARPASVTFITRPPRIVYQRTTPARVVTTTVTRTAPAYRYNVNRPRTYNSYYRPTSTVTRTTTRTAPTGRTVTTTRTWRRR